jgi:hypothetical protein
MQQSIKHRIGQRTGGRLQRLKVEVLDDTVIISGCAPSYYIKQLAILGVLDVLGVSASKRIELNVEVVADPANYEEEAS